MKRFEHKQVREAIAYAEAGGQALHIWDPGPGGYPGAPAVFQKHRPWAHLIDHDQARLVQTAKRLGVKVIKVGRPGGRGQHIDLCGAPLDRAIEICAAEEVV